MRIRPVKAYYVTTKDETTIIYKEKQRNRETEKTVVIKGRLKVKPTIHNILNIIEKNV